MPSRRTNNSPESGRGLGHMTPTIFDIRSTISLKLLKLQTSNLVCSFVWAMPSRRTNNFPSKWAWPRSRDPYNFGSTVGYPSDSLASCSYAGRKRRIQFVQCTSTTTNHFITTSCPAKFDCIAQRQHDLCTSCHYQVIRRHVIGQTLRCLREIRTWVQLSSCVACVALLA